MALSFPKKIHASEINEICAVTGSDVIGPACEQNITKITSQTEEKDLMWLQIILSLGERRRRVGFNKRRAGSSPF